MRHTFLFKHFLVISLSILFFAGCKDSPVEPENLTVQEALEKMVKEDSALASFDANYIEDEATAFIGKVNTQIYPHRIGLKVRILSTNLNIEIKGDSAFGKLTKTYEGVLLIAASYEENNDSADTLIQKPVTAVVTRNIIFKKIANTDRPLKNWRVAAISLPQGGVLSPNIDIKKLTVFLPNGDSIVVTSPNDYYLDRWFRHWWRNIPVIARNHDVTIKVELYSAYAENDFVTLKYGANKDGLHRAKKLLKLVSSTPSGSGYEKVYEQTYRTHQFPGFYHAVINAFPRQVIFDDAAPVENEMWGVPYFIK